MRFTTVISEAYGEGACLYETILGVSKDASPSQLRKAYYKQCLCYHPDKLSADLSNDERELAKRKFQAISLAYAILSDDEKRKEYDDSGELHDDDDDDDDFAMNKDGFHQWTEYFNKIFPKVTTADIEAFEVKYKCSDEEEADVLKYYSQFKGDLNKMLECVMLSSDVDKERWVKDYIEPAMKRGDVDDYSAKIKKTLGHGRPKSTTKKNNRKRGDVTKTGTSSTIISDEVIMNDSDSDTPMAQVVVVVDDERMDDDDNVESRTKKGKKSSSKAISTSSRSISTTTTHASTKKKSKMDDNQNLLIAQIRGNSSSARRQAGFESLMAGLEERYGGGSSNKKTKSGKKRQQQKNDITASDIDDDEFARIQSKMMKNRELKQRPK